MTSRLLTLPIAAALALALASDSARAQKPWDDNHRFAITAGSHHADHITALVEFHLKKGWTTYWKNPGDAGLPFHITESDLSNADSLRILWPTPERLPYEGGLESFGYKDYVAIPIRANIRDSSEPVRIHIKGRYSVCETLCIPYDFDETLFIPTDHTAPQTDRLISDALAKNPAPLPSARVQTVMGAENLTLNITHAHAHQASAPRDIILDAGAPINLGKPQITESSGAISARFPQPLPKDMAGEPLKMEILLLYENAAYRISANAPASASPIGMTPWILLLLSAFLGGLILNIMPCVLPVVSLKIAHLHYGASRLPHNSQILHTIFGIFAAFLLFAFLIALLQSAGQTVGWGFHFQNPIFVAAMMTLLAFFTLAQVGIFKLFTPHAVHAGIDRVFNILSPDRRLFHLFYGAVITLLATPCTAPFLGGAVAFALTRDTPSLLLVFLAIAAGLAAPYILLLLLPKDALLRYAPKQGAWTIAARHAITLLLAGSTIWLAWVLARQIGSLPAISVFFAALAALLLLKTKDFRAPALIALPLLVGAPLFATPTPASAPASSATDRLGLTWHPFNPQEIKSVTAKGKTVFLDITARWCLTCAYNRWNVLGDPDVIARLGGADIHLMRGDLTQPDPQIMAFIREQGRAGIPFNAIYRGEGATILSELLNKDALLKALSANPKKAEKVAPAALGFLAKSD